MCQPIEAQLSFNSQRFRRTLSKFVTGVVIATTCESDGKRVGLTVNSFTSLSLDPPLILFNVGKNASSIAAWRKAEYFAVNILNESQETISNRFARSNVDKWESVTSSTGQIGVPTITNALAVLECKAYARYSGGDHEIIVGHVVALREHPTKSKGPLVFFDGGYRRLAMATTEHKPSEE
jgi:flavin reductase (DIM6/NTAB) family NADH-FMN oxidoreductase RutF